MGTGFPADYTEAHQRRLAMWMRCRDLVEDPMEWIGAAEKHGDGWLVNDGTGIRWYATIDNDLSAQLVLSGFVAVPCGIAG